MVCFMLLKQQSSPASFLLQAYGSACPSVSQWSLAGHSLKEMAVTKRILVIDDKPNLLALLRMLLEEEQYQVSVLQDGREAVQVIRENPPDLVILDLKLDEVSGTDILESLRAHEGTAEIPVIIYTAAVLEAEAVSKLVTGNPTRYANVSVVQKPFELDTLLGRVQQVLGAAHTA